MRRVGEGGSALDPAVVSQLVGRRRADDPLDALTPREREVLELMAEGRSNQAIAERMFVTLRAVEKHVTSIFTKLDLPASSDDHRRVLAVLTFLRTEDSAGGATSVPPRGPGCRASCGIRGELSLSSGFRDADVPGRPYLPSGTGHGETRREACSSSGRRGFRDTGSSSGIPPTVRLAPPEDA